MDDGDGGVERIAARASIQRLWVRREILQTKEGLRHETLSLRKGERVGYAEAQSAATSTRSSCRK